MATPPFFNRSQLVEMLEHARLFLQAATSGLANDRLEGEPVNGVWTVRDIVAHLVGWERELHEEARAVVRRNGAVFTYTIDSAHDWKEWNAQQVELRKGKSVGQVFLELEQVQLAVIEWVRGLPESRLHHEASYPWGGKGTVSWLLSILAGHKVSHGERIRAWRVTHNYRR